MRDNACSVLLFGWAGCAVPSCRRGTRRDWAHARHLPRGLSGEWRVGGCARVPRNEMSPVTLSQCLLPRGSVRTDVLKSHLAFQGVHCTIHTVWRHPRRTHANAIRTLGRMTRTLWILPRSMLKLRCRMLSLDEKLRFGVWIGVRYVCIYGYSRTVTDTCSLL